MSPAGNAGFESDPACVASHDLHHHDAVVRFGGGVNLIHGVGSRGERGIETKSDFSGREVVVNGFGYAHDRHASTEKFECDGLRALAADADYRIDPELAGIGDDFIRNIARDFLAVFDGAVLEGIAAIGGAQDGAAARQNPADVLQREFVGFFRPDQPVEAVRDADDFPLIFQERAI